MYHRITRHPNFCYMEINVALSKKEKSLNGDAETVNGVKCDKCNRAGTARIRPTEFKLNKWER